MKKINLLIATLILTGFAFMSSCTKDTNPPTINFKGGATYTSTDVTIDAGSSLTFGILAQPGGAKLQSLKVVATTDNTPLVLDEITISCDSFDQDLTYSCMDAGVTRMTFTITDKDNQTAEVSLTVTITAVDNISSYTETKLGSYANTTLGSSFASADGSVYMMADAKTNAAKVDWLYYYGGASNLATLAAPDDASAATVFNGVNGLQTWTVKNNTRFRAVTEGVVWDNILTADDIAAIATNTVDTKENLLQTGNILAFKTASDKLGIIKIGTIVTGSNGTITYDVKVQK
jgi:hypothetical protein